jgi:hypothetical protein
MQQTLFNKHTEPLARPLSAAKAAGRAVPHSGGSTSRAAAREIKPEAGPLCAAVLAFLVGRGETGATDSEIQTALGLSGDTERPRRVALQRRGLVVDSGQRRRTSSGRAAIVWRARAAEAPK